MNRPKILIVDDESAIRELLSEFLTKENYEVMGAANGRAALDLCKQHPFALVLTDHKMPGGGANALLEGLRQLSQIPVILMTGHSDISDAQKAGFVEVFIKPFPPRDLVAAINSILKSNGSRD